MRTMTAHLSMSDGLTATPACPIMTNALSAGGESWASDRTGRAAQSTGRRSSMAEQRFCKPSVGGSTPLAGFIAFRPWREAGHSGSVPEWLKGSDCKSDARATLVRIHPGPCTVSSFEFLVLSWGTIRSEAGLSGAVVAHHLGKMGVMGSNPMGGSILRCGSEPTPGFEGHG